MENIQIEEKYLYIYFVSNNKCIFIHRYKKRNIMRLLSPIIIALYIANSSFQSYSKLNRL